MKRLALIAPVIFGLWFMLSGAGVFLGVADSSCDSMSISSVTGSIGAGNQLTINGTCFGNGPTIEIYDSFEGGVDATDINLAANVNAWTSLDNGIEPQYTTVAKSGSFGARMFAANTVEWKMRRTFASAATEFFLSYHFIIPDGTTFPGETDEETFPSSPYGSWKFAWVLGNPSCCGGGTQDDDMTIPTWDGNIHIVSNNFGGYLGDWPNKSNWWVWDEWMRITTHNISGADVEEDNGASYQESISSLGRFSRTHTSSPMFPDEADGETPQWESIVMTGAYDNPPEASTDVAVTYDRVYLATGQYSRAHVEVCDNATWGSATDCIIMPHDTWGASQIIVDEFDDPSAVMANGWLFVIDSDGNVSNGDSIF